MADLSMIETQQFDHKLKSILRLSTYEEYDDLSGLDVNYEDAQQIFLLDELRGSWNNFQICMTGLHTFSAQ